VTAAELQAYLHAHIPLTRALALEVREISESHIELSAPLAPNLNHRQTAFGGSVASLAILAGWGWLHARLASIAPDSRLVIQRQEMEYVTPIDAAMSATCSAPAPPEWNRFVRALLSRGRARIELGVKVVCEGRIAARFVGTYVALRGGAAVDSR